MYVESFIATIWHFLKNIRKENAGSCFTFACSGNNLKQRKRQGQVLMAKKKLLSTLV